jgi:phosphomannomutase/phosphoglucomutase
MQLSVFDLDSFKMEIDPTIFREYDIRGVAGRNLSPEFAECLGLGYAQILRPTTPVAGRKKLTVAVGKDCRLSSDSYASAVVRGLIQGGLDVIRLGMCPTPLTYFSLFHLDLDGAIMVTASHNPPDQNGFKICIGRDAIYGHQIQELRGIMESDPQASRNLGMASDFEIIPAYTSYLQAHIATLNRKKIVIDSGNGTAGIVAPGLLRSLGVDVIELYSEPDGRFPNHIPDPTVAINQVDLIASVQKNQADFGIGFDGDADRIGVVDERGCMIPGDELMVIFARSILSKNPGATVISEVKSSFRLFDDVRQKGGKPVMWKVGHSLIKAKMKETGALLAGELSGHIFFADRYYGFDDAIYAALRLLEIASKIAGPISSLVSDLDQTFSTLELRIQYKDSLKFQLVEKVKTLLVENPLIPKDKITTIDGIRVDFGDGWGLIRASNTQPAVTMRFEAISKARLTEIKKLFEAAINGACRALDQPAIKIE